MYILHLVIPGPLPKSLNRELRTHWRKRHAANSAWDSLIHFETLRQKPPAPLTRARLSFARHSHRTLDYDGLIGSLKPVVDALVAARILSDDTWGVTGPWTARPVFRAKKEGEMLEIYVEELPPEFPNGFPGAPRADTV